MANNRQKTLLETWSKTSGSLFQGHSGLSSFQRGGSTRQTISKDVTRARRGQPNNRSNRGGGRAGRGSYRVKVSNVELSDGTIVIDDEDDDICQQALGQAELANNDVTAAFIDLNAAKELPGFDKEAGSIWIYPTNCSVRNYQYDIVQTALFNNTLVSLPTGMGKTFIAAVVMYNLHRWYPQDYIVFMAPTKPLVTQQLEACHNIVGIHPSKTVELTGNILPKKREDLWKSKTVFFLTPQVMISDLNRGACPFNKVRCIVVDEAHKAMGNHAYVQVISKIAEYQKQFRVLALSATPGSDMLAVQQVFKNLMISKVELRSEDSSDLLPYTHKKQIEQIVVELDAYIMSVDNELKQIFQMYTGKLMQLKILSGKDGSAFTQFQLLQARGYFRNSPPPSIPNYLNQKGYIESHFATCISLAHALELLIIHGVRSCYVFLQGICDKERGHGAVSDELRKNVALRTLLNEIQVRLNISVENSTLSLSSSALFTSFSSDNNTSHYIPQEGKETDYALSHPKLGVLKDIVVKHFESFQRKNETTRVMIFSQYRDSVQEIVSMLNTLRPLVKPAIFVGQAKSGAGGAGLNQKKQGEVLQHFREGKYNVLASTCVGEEGLNIGEVDLIICFDASKSPTRLVQRMGRTGRQRKGKTIFLLTKGKEERTYQSSVNMQGNISRNITDVSKFQPYLYQYSPRMIPAGLNPVCYKMKVVLSSEREEYGDTVLPKDREDENFTKPDKPPRRKEQRKQVNTKEDKSAKSSKSVETKIDDAFKNVVAKNAFANLPFNTTVDEKYELKVSTNIIEREMETDHIYTENSEVDLDNRRFLYDLFDIEDNNENCASCIFIPTPPNTIIPIRGSTVQLTDADQEALLFDESELQCLKENIEAIALIGSLDGRCVCGNINTTVLDLCTGDLKSFSSDEECPEKDNNYFKQGNTNYNRGSTLLKFPQKTSSCSSPYQMKKQVTNNEHSYANKVDLDFDADAAFIFDENNPVLKDGDDWKNEINGNSKIKEERSISKSPTIKRFKFKNRDEANRLVIPPTSKNNCMTRKIEPPNTLSNKADKLNFPIVTKTTEEPLICYTQTEYANMFADEILFDDDSDGENNSCDINSRKEFQTKEDSDIFKSEETEDIAPNANQLNDSSTASEGIFNPLRSKQDDERFTFAPKSCVQSTPNKVFVADDLSQAIVNVDNEKNNSEDWFPTSPDLSQYRLQNQVKRAKLDSDSYCPISNTYASMTAPENDSANMLNRFVEEMRQKHSQSPCLIQAAKETEKLEIKSNATSDLSSEKPKKKFVFKKRSSGFSNQEDSIISPVLPVQKIESKTIAFDNIIPPPPDTFKTYINEPRKFIGLSRMKKLTSDIDFDKNPILSPTETIDDKKKFSFKRTHVKNDEIDNIQNDMRQYKMQYCSEDILDVTDLDVFSHDGKERTQLKNIKKENRSKELIEQRRLQAIELRRKSKMMITEEISSLQSLKIIQPINQEKIDSSLKLPRNKTCQLIQHENIEIPPIKEEIAALMTVPRSIIHPRRPQENIKIATPIETPTKSKIETNKSSRLCRKTTKASEGDKVNNRKPSATIPDASGFSDDDDFDFVRPLPRQLHQMNSTLKSPQHVEQPMSLRQKQVMVSHTSPEFSLKRNIRRKLPRNPYVEDEAEASDDSSDCDGDDDLEELDELDDSFVTQNYDEDITNTQQARYVESTKDVMRVPFSRIERDCLPTLLDPLHAYSEYENDSFCVNNDEVDFAEVGCFTQAMNKAKSDLEMGGDNSKRQTRRAERLKQINAEYLAESNKPSDGDKKKRRRVILLDSSDED